MPAKVFFHPENSFYTKKELQANRKAWIAALRSGKYTQGTDFLSRNNEFCCLGVACEVLGLNSSIKTLLGDSIAYYKSIAYYEERVAPSSVQKALGIYNDCGYGTGDKTLTELNDEGVSFEEIADRLETGEFWAENLSEDLW